MQAVVAVVAAVARQESELSPGEPKRLMYYNKPYVSHVTYIDNSGHAEKFFVRNRVL